jgi:para-nitrobenzyl esterase
MTRQSSRYIARRQFVKQTTLVAGAALAGVHLAGCSRDAAPAASKAQRSLAPIAKTAAGLVRGVLKDGIYVFKGVPYGASTSGANRFMPPQPPVPWSGVRDALDYGPSTPQREPDVVRVPRASAEFIGDLSSRPESEDCLVLNVWTPGLDDGGKRPVMFWIHGGGFQSGSGSSPTYDGTRLAKRGDVVVVTINHRLNVLGFAYLAPIGGERYAQSGNVGMLDIVHALEWVRDNIENFGGDPHRVMIFGESGGGRKVGTLLAMPAAKGLFHRAVIQSGPTIRVRTPEDATFATQAVIEELQIGESNLEKLQELPYERIMKAYFVASRKHNFNHTTTGFAPVVDGTVLPAHPFDPVAADVMPEVPLIVGCNRTEYTLQLAGDAEAFRLDEAGMRKRVEAFLGDKAPEVIEAYRKAEPNASPSELFFLMISDFRYCAPIATIAERRAALNAGPVYAYYFTWETPVRNGELRSPHALEIPFVFDNTEIAARFTGGGERALKLADAMSDAWIAFARDGSPTTPKLPTWSLYDAVKRETMVFNDRSELVSDPYGARRRAMQAAMGLLST